MSKYYDYSKLSNDDLKRLAKNIKNDMDNKKAIKRRDKIKLVEGKIKK